MRSPFGYSIELVWYMLVEVDSHVTRMSSGVKLICGALVFPESRRVKLSECRMGK